MNAGAGNEWIATFCIKSIALPVLGKQQHEKRAISTSEIDFYWQTKCQEDERSQTNFSIYSQLFLSGLDGPW